MLKIKKYKDYEDYKKVQIQRTKEKIKQNNINKHLWYLTGDFLI